MEEIENESPLTGVRGRTPSLEHVDITSIENYSQDKTHYDKFSSSIPYSSNTMTPIRPTEDNSMKKCVYMYEDKYTFSRILPPAHLLQLKENYPGKSNHIFYDLYMHEDINSMSGTAQWFYFSVSGMRAKQTVIFSIRNFSKSESLYDLGMKPLLLSIKSGSGWVRCGSNVTYREETESKNLNNRQSNCRQRYYVLTFTHTFEYDDDICYFAYSHPYTYTDLKNYLKSIDKQSPILSRSELCKTLAGNVCDLLTITNPPVLAPLNPSCEGESIVSIKPHILITARVHPGEVSSSWMMQGVIDFLISDLPEANQLREMCVFKIIPMLNPDGVVNGNNRASLSGQDLNRVWDRPTLESHPTIYNCKKLAQELQGSQTTRVCLYLDLHAHSKHKGIFAFGCVVGDVKEEIFSTTSSRERHISPTQLRTKVIRSNSTSSSTSTSYSQKNLIPESNVIQGGGPTQGIAMALKERSRSAGPQGRLGNKVPTPPVDQIIKMSSRLDTDSVLSTSSRNVSPARFLELKYERVKKLPKIFNKNIKAFSHRLCSYQVPSNKLSTSRAVMALEIGGVEHSYTIEASMAGSHDDLFQPSDYLQIGSEIGSSIFEWLTTDNLIQEFCSPRVETPEISSDSEIVASVNSSKRMPPRRRRRTDSGENSKSEGIASSLRNEKLMQDNRTSISPDVIFSEKPPSDLYPLSAQPNEKISALRNMRQQSREQRVRRIIPQALSMQSNFGNIVFDPQTSRGSESQQNQMQIFPAEGKPFQRKPTKPKPVNLPLGH